MGSRDREPYLDNVRGVNYGLRKYYVRSLDFAADATCCALIGPSTLMSADRLYIVPPSSRFSELSSPGSQRTSLRGKASSSILEIQLRDYRRSAYRHHGDLSNSVLPSPVPSNVTLAEEKRHATLTRPVELASSKPAKSSFEYTPHHRMYTPLTLPISLTDPLVEPPRCRNLPP